MFLDLQFCVTWAPFFQQFVQNGGMRQRSGKSLPSIELTVSGQNILLLFRSAISLSLLPKASAEMVRNREMLLLAGSPDLSEQIFPFL